jgi:hypothetical protein
MQRLYCIGGLFLAMAALTSGTQIRRKKVVMLDKITYPMLRKRLAEFELL